MWLLGVSVFTFLRNVVHVKLDRISVLRGLDQRDERVNEGEGVCTGAFGIKPPQARTTRTACVSVV